eukprot:609613-Pyramimonas_sp.AAC.1
MGADCVSCARSNIMVHVCGNHVSFPGYEVQRDPRSSQVLHDAYSLDCRIRSAVESVDLLREWTKGLGKQVSETARRNCSGIQKAMDFMHTSTESHSSVK